MKRILLALSIPFVLLAGAVPRASAQFNANPGLFFTGTQQKKISGGISIFPVSVFDIGGTYNTGNSGTQSLYGVLTDLEFGTVYKPTKTLYQFGGWYWGRSGNDLYEVHVRVQGSGGLGLQFGYLNTTQGFVTRPGDVTTEARSFDVFVLYGFGSRSLGIGKKKGYHHWNLEFGLGVFVDASKHYLYATQTTPPRISNSATANYTFYVSGAYELGGPWTLQLSEWSLRDRFQELNRAALGIGFSF